MQISGVRRVKIGRRGTSDGGRSFAYWKPD